jgi:hypothetical protein
MKVYVEAFYPDGSQILGNLDGQAVIRAKNYRRTQAYKRLRSILYNSTRVASFRIVAEDGRVLETVS